MLYLRLRLDKTSEGFEMPCYSCWPHVVLIQAAAYHSNELRVV